MSGGQGDMSGEEAGDMMLNEMNDIQDKTKSSLANTKNMVAASKQVGEATMEELLHQPITGFPISHMSYLVTQ